jgi:hypothetical protein
MPTAAPPIIALPTSLALDVLQGVHKFMHFYRSTIFTLRRGPLSLLFHSWQLPLYGRTLLAGCLVLLGPPTLLSSLGAARWSQ